MQRRVKAAAQHNSSRLGSAFTLHFICKRRKQTECEAPKLVRRRQDVEPQAVRASSAEDTRTHRSTKPKASNYDTNQQTTTALRTDHAAQPSRTPQVRTGRAHRHLLPQARRRKHLPGVPPAKSRQALQRVLLLRPHFKGPRMPRRLLRGLQTCRPMQCHLQESFTINYLFAFCLFAFYS